MASAIFHARSAFHKSRKGLISLKKALAEASAFFMAEDEGFEPPQTESESGVLPLHKSSIFPWGNAPIIPNLSEMSRTISGNPRIFFWLLICCRQKETAPYFSGLRGGVFPTFPTGNFLLLNLRDSHGMLLNI